MDSDRAAGMIAIGLFGSVMLLWTLVMVWRTKALLERLQGVIPDREAVKSAATTGTALSRSLDAHRGVTERLPQLAAERVAGSVSDGLAPFTRDLERLTREAESMMRTVSQALTRSHEDFTRAVLTLNQDGSLGDWVGALRETIAPLAEVASSVERQQAGHAALLETVGELVRQWAEQREAVQAAYARFAQLVEQSAAAEATSLRNIEDRIMQRLEEEAGTRAEIARSLSELQTAERRAAATHERLAESVERTVSSVNELIRLGQQTQERHHELIRSQSEAMQQFEGMKRDTGEALAGFQTRLREVPAEVSRALAAVTEAAAAGVRELSEAARGAHDQHVRALEALRQQQDAVVAGQVDLLAKQRGLLSSVSARLETMTTHRQATVMIVLAVLQAALLIGVIGVLAPH